MRARAAVLLLAGAAVLAAGPGRPFAARAGMGGVGVGIPDDAGELDENPSAAAMAAGVTREDGLVHLGGAWERVSFAGRALNPLRSTEGSFGALAGLGFSVVTPDLGGHGRLGVGVWELESRTLALTEPLDVSLPEQPWDGPLAGMYAAGESSFRTDEALVAAGAVWIAPVGEGDQQVALGLAGVDLTGLGSVSAVGTLAADGTNRSLLNRRTGRSQNGLAALASYCFRPLPDGCLGINIVRIFPLDGQVWMEDEGGPLYRSGLTRPAQLRVGFGGSFAVVKDFIVAVDLKYAGGVEETATVFGGTPAQRLVSEKSDPGFAIHAGGEYRWRLASGRQVPVRLGFFTRPDPLPVSTAGQGAVAVTDFLPAAFKQDVTGFTAGTGWAAPGLRIDVAFLYLLVDTRVRIAGATGPVESGDVRGSPGLVGSVTLRFSGNAARMD